MIIESGIIIVVSFVALFIKLPRRWILVALGWPITLDLTFSGLAYILHFGTLTGVLAAAVAGLAISALSSLARRLVGYMEYNRYVPGYLDWSAYATPFALPQVLPKKTSAPAPAPAKKSKKPKKSKKSKQKAAA